MNRTEQLIVLLHEKADRLDAMNAGGKLERELAAALAAQTALLWQCKEALDGARGNINPERGFADEVEEEVANALSAVEAWENS